MRLVVTSTNGVFGNAHGRIVDETHRRYPSEGFMSWDDESKLRADTWGPA